jgi:hypothetical protein
MADKIIYIDNANMLTQVFSVPDITTASQKTRTEIPKNACESPAQKKNSCDCCGYSTNNKKDYHKHLTTKKHKITEEAAIARPPIGTPRYYCKTCNYVSKNKTDFIRHQNTKKHIKIVETENKKIIADDNKSDGDLPEPMEEERTTQNEYIPAGLLVDILKQNKELQQALIEQTQELQHSLIEQNREFQNSLVVQNKEIQNTLVELSKQATTINTTHHNDNSTTNNQFNLNFFLNNDCKDAMNIAEFIASLKLTVQDIEETGRLGFIEGITRIFVHALRALDVNMRPLHCTDMKRETIYIKDQDMWEKEDAEKTKLRQVLKQIARKNLRMLPAWQNENPNYVHLDTPENEQFLQISLSSLGPESREEESKHEDKIIRNVLKEVSIDKARPKSIKT